MRTNSPAATSRPLPTGTRDGTLTPTWLRAATDRLPSALASTSTYRPSEASASHCSCTVPGPLAWLTQNDCRVGGLVDRRSPEMRRSVGPLPLPHAWVTSSRAVPDSQLSTSDASATPRKIGVWPWAVAVTRTVPKSPHRTCHRLSPWMVISELTTAAVGVVSVRSGLVAYPAVWRAELTASSTPPPSPMTTPPS